MSCACALVLQLLVEGVPGLWWGHCGQSVVCACVSRGRWAGACQPWAVGGGVSGGWCVVCVCQPVSCPLAAALRAWNSCNTYMPSRIIVYRDGVGDGQLKTLVSYEVPQFLDCLKSMGRGYR